VGKLVLAIETDPRAIRIQARIETFSAVVRDDGLDAARVFYLQNRDNIVPANVVRQAEQAGEDPTKAVEREAVTLFERDVRVAQRFDEGVKIGEQTLYLGDLIAQERGKLFELRQSRLKS
jgi:hypothetical protein